MSDHPDITLAVSNVLGADPDVSAITSQVFINRLPQNIDGPSVVLWVIAETPFNHLGGSLGMDQALIQLDSYGTSPGIANTLAWRVWLALDNISGVFAGVFVKGAMRRSGIRNASDRVLVGTDQYRFIASQDFRFTYCSREKVV